jgi:hypothetical protein
LVQISSKKKPRTGKKRKRKKRISQLKGEVGLIAYLFDGKV